MTKIGDIPERKSEENENNKLRNKLGFQSKNIYKLTNNRLLDVIKFEKHLYELDILEVTSKESFEDQLFNSDNKEVDKFIEFAILIGPLSIENIRNLKFYEKKHSFGVIERFKIVNWLSLHSNRLKFQSCTFHLSCRILDIFLLETDKIQTQCELATSAAASFLLASNIIETTSDMIVPTIKQFCNAAKWLNSKKIIKKQMEILTTVKKSFNITLTPLKLLIIYISRIRNHAILSREFGHVLIEGKIVEILSFCLGICDLVLYNPISTNKYGQIMLLILPSFILWNQLHVNYKYSALNIKFIRNQFFTEICLFGEIFSEEIINIIGEISNKLIEHNELYVKDFNTKNTDKDILRIHKHIPYKHD